MFLKCYRNTDYFFNKSPHVAKRNRQWTFMQTSFHFFFEHTLEHRGSSGGTHAHTLEDGGEQSSSVSPPGSGWRTRDAADLTLTDWAVDRFFKKIHCSTDDTWFPTFLQNSLWFSFAIDLCQWKALYPASPQSSWRSGWVCVQRGERH